MFGKFFKSRSLPWTLTFCRDQRPFVRAETNDPLTLLIWMGSSSKGRPPSDRWVVTVENAAKNVQFNLDSHTYVDGGHFSQSFYQFATEAFEQMSRESAKFSVRDLRDGQVVAVDPPSYPGLMELVELKESKAVRPANLFELFSDVFNDTHVYRSPY